MYLQLSQIQKKSCSLFVDSNLVPTMKILWHFSFSSWNFDLSILIPVNIFSFFVAIFVHVKSTLCEVATNFTHWTAFHNFVIQYKLRLKITQLCFGALYIKIIQTCNFRKKENVTVWHHALRVTNLHLCPTSIPVDVELK